MSNAKKGIRVVLAGVCSSTASAGARDVQIGCGIRKRSRRTKWRLRLTYCGSGSFEDSHVPLSPLARPTKLAVSWAPRARMARRRAELAANAGRSHTHLTSPNSSNFPSLRAYRPSQAMLPSRRHRSLPLPSPILGYRASYMRSPIFWYPLRHRAWRVEPTAAGSLACRQRTSVTSRERARPSSGRCNLLDSRIKTPP
jgi:hypothetical protein